MPRGSEPEFAGIFGSFEDQQGVLLWPSCHSSISIKHVELHQIPCLYFHRWPAQRIKAQAVQAIVLASFSANLRTTCQKVDHRIQPLDSSFLMPALDGCPGFTNPWFGFIRGYPRKARKAINIHRYVHRHIKPWVYKLYITDKLQKWDQVKRLEPQVFINPRFTCVLTSHPRGGHPACIRSLNHHKNIHNPMLRIMQFCFHFKTITPKSSPNIVEKSILHNDD